MSETLNILRAQHQAVLDYEDRRESLLGPRDEHGSREVRRIVAAHLVVWESAGGKPEEFLLAPWLENARVSDAKPKGDEASDSDASTPSGERPKGKARKPALNSVKGEV